MHRSFMRGGQSAAEKYLRRLLIAIGVSVSALSCSVYDDSCEFGDLACDPASSLLYLLGVGADLNRATIFPGETVALSNGDGSFRTPVNYPSPMGGAGDGGVTGDFNNDGVLDIVLTETTGPDIEVLLGN